MYVAEGTHFEFEEGFEEGGEGGAVAMVHWHSTCGAVSIPATRAPARGNGVGTRFEAFEGEHRADYCIGSTGKDDASFFFALLFAFWGFHYVTCTRGSVRSVPHPPMM
jgi:hypothetical protein